MALQVEETLPVVAVFPCTVSVRVGELCLELTYLLYLITSGPLAQHLPLFFFLMRIAYCVEKGGVVGALWQIFF